MSDVGAIHHHAAEDCKLGNGRTDLVNGSAKCATIVGEWFDSAAPHGGAFKFLFVVWMSCEGPELDLGVGL